MKTFNHQDKTRQPTSWPGLTGGQDLGDGDDRYLPSNSSHTIISRHISCKSSLGGSSIATCKVNSSHQQHQDQLYLMNIY